MKKFFPFRGVLTWMLAVLFWSCDRPDASTKSPIRVAIIGGMTSTGMWQALAVRFEKDTGWKTVIVATGPKDILTSAFHQGKVDFLTMHSSDEATNLVAEGYGMGIVPWAQNEHILVGPPGDPAQVRGMVEGSAALKKIAESHSNFVDFSGPGSREVVHRLWKKAGIQPVGDWLLKDESLTPQSILLFSAAKKAYVVTGRIPYLSGKTPTDNLEIMVQGDPQMRRTYVVILANPEKSHGINIAGAKVLRDYLTSAKTRLFLHQFASQQPGSVPLFYPLPDSSSEGVAK